MAVSNLSSNKKNWLIAIVVLSLLAIWVLYTNNKFIGKDENVTKYFNNLQSEYQRRMDLVPNLVSAVKASTDYEKETLTKLIEARANALQGMKGTADATPDNHKKREQLQADVAVNANRVIAVIERYPDLKSTNAFVRLQDQLSGTERRVKFSRNDFNDAVKGYNQYVRSFPSSIVASLFGHKTKDGFTADTGTDKAPEINFGK
jgi:LemA protein